MKVIKQLTRREFSIGTASATLAVALANKTSAGASYASDQAELTSLTLSQVAAKLRALSISSVDVVRACLNRIDGYDKKLNTFITVMHDEALAQAKALDIEAAAHKFRSPLHGVPIALKDNIDTAGIRTTAASAVFEDRVPTADAEVVRKLKDAGAVIIGKANLGEFALSATGAASHFGPVRNPWALDHISGGSSSGAAAALAADFCYGALGTDTGGSVRIPAAYCGVVSLKPTHGLVSVRGIVQAVLSLDSCGPMARSVADAALLLNAISGYDKLDIGSAVHATEDYTALIRQPVSSLRVGIPKRPYFYDVDREIGESVEAALGVISKLTRGMKDVSLPLTGDLSGARVEYTAYHHRLQQEGYSARYGQISPTLPVLSIERCTQLAPGKCNRELDAYVQWRRDLELLRRTADDVFSDFDVVIVPTVKVMPILIGDALKSEARADGRTLIDNTVPFNLYGWPAISLPCGFSSDGFPVGLTIAGPHFSEGKLIALAYAYERATSWHLQRPTRYL